MNEGNPNATNRKTTQSAQPVRPAQPAQSADAGLNIADQPVVPERKEDVAKINQGDMLEPLVRQHGAKMEENP